MVLPREIYCLFLFYKKVLCIEDMYVLKRTDPCLAPGNNGQKTKRRGSTGQQTDWRTISCFKKTFLIHYEKTYSLSTGQQTRRGRPR